MSYFPVIRYEQKPPIFDLANADINNGTIDQEWGIGKYNEKRLNVYKQFYHGDRNIHVGVDLFCPVGSPVHAFTDGELFLFANNSTPGDYGYTLVYKHYLQNGDVMYALYGHLSASSVMDKKTGQSVTGGQIVGWTGDRTENGGWPSHVHFQLSINAPEVCDMPGVVAENQLTESLKLYPDPRTVLGAIF